MDIRLVGMDHCDGMESVTICDGHQHRYVMLAMRWPPISDDCPYADHSPEARERRKFYETPGMGWRTRPCHGSCQQFTDIAPELLAKLEKVRCETMEFRGKLLPTGVLVSEEVEALLQGPLMAVEVGTSYGKRSSQSTHWLLEDGRVLRLETDFEWAAEDPTLYQRHELTIREEDWHLERLDDAGIHEQVRIALRQEA